MKFFLKNILIPADAQLLINNFLLCSSHAPLFLFLFSICADSRGRWHWKAPVPSPSSKGCHSTLLSTAPTPVLNTPRVISGTSLHRWSQCSATLVDGNVLYVQMDGYSCDSVCAHLFSNRKPLQRVWCHLLYPTSPHIYTQ